MRVQIRAVGRLRAGPEKQLLDDYLSRLEAAGRAIGITSAPVIEVEEKRRLDVAALKTREGELLRAATAKGATIVALDERGRAEPSEAFAKRLGHWRDAGVGDIAFLIGGAYVASRRRSAKAQPTPSPSALQPGHICWRA